jgi:hypothetical protein
MLTVALAGLAAAATLSTATSAIASTPAKAGPAPKAACSLTIHYKNKIGIAAAHNRVAATVTGCEAPGIFEAQTALNYPNSHAQWDFWSWSDAGTESDGTKVPQQRTSYIDFPGAGTGAAPTGKYLTSPGSQGAGFVWNPAHDGGGDGLDYATVPSVTVKYSTRVSLHATRSGSNVTLAATLVRWTAASGWAGYGGREMRFQELVGGVWKPVKTVPTNSHGQASVVHLLRTAASYRVVILEAPRYWGITSSTVRK